MPQLSTGLVIAGAYADKVRRVLFAQLRDELKKGAIDAQTVARRSAELNRLLFDILVNKLKLDKGDVVRIRIEYELEDHDIRWKLDTLQVEAFRRIPDEETMRAVKETIERAEEVITAPVTGEEREWHREAETVAKPETLPARIASAQEIGETVQGERLFALRDDKDRNIGLAIIGEEDGKTKATIILVPRPHEAYMAEQAVDKPVGEVSEADIPVLAEKASYTRIEPRKAEEIIKEKMLNIK